MKGTKRQEAHTIIKDENGRRLEANEEVVEVFKNRLQRTFKIIEEESERFDEGKEREVEEWMLRNQNRRRIEKHHRLQRETVDNRRMLKTLLNHSKKTHRDH